MIAKTETTTLFSYSLAPCCFLNRPEQVGCGKGSYQLHAFMAETTGFMLAVVRREV